MKTQYANDNSSVKIYGDHSPWPVIATTEVVAHLGGEESAYHEIKRMQPFLPAPMLEAHPLGMLELGFARENEQRGEKYWCWRRMEGQAVKKSTGYDYVKGFGHAETDGFVFVNSNTREIVYEIRG